VMQAPVHSLAVMNVIGFAIYDLLFAIWRSGKR
jgi:hypothetical protein